MVPGCSSSLDNFMASGSSPDSSAQDSPCAQKPPSQVSLWSSVVAGAMSTDTDHGCTRVTRPDMALAHSPGPNNTMSSSGKQASHINLFFTALASSDLSLSTEHAPLSVPFYPYPTIYLLTVRPMAYSHPLRAKCSEPTYICPPPAARF